MFDWYRLVNGASLLILESREESELCVVRIMANVVRIGSLMGQTVCKGIGTKWSIWVGFESWPRSLRPDELADSATESKE